MRRPDDERMRARRKVKTRACGVRQERVAESGSPRHLHFALVHRVHDNLCQKANEKRKENSKSNQKDTRRGRADSTDSALIDKRLRQVGEKKELQNTSFIP